MRASTEREKSNIMKVLGRVNGAPLIYEFSLANDKIYFSRDLIARDSAKWLGRVWH